MLVELNMRDVLIFAAATVGINKKNRDSIQRGVHGCACVFIFVKFTVLKKEK
jgi:hypothetical protein